MQSSPDPILIEITSDIRFPQEAVEAFIAYSTAHPHIKWRHAHYSKWAGLVLKDAFSRNVIHLNGLGYQLDHARNLDGAKAVIAILQHAGFTVSPAELIVKITRLREFEIHKKT